MSSGTIRTFDGATVLITGGASGIGRAFGEAVAERGADVVLADLQSTLAIEAADAIRKRGGKATGAALDVRDRAAVERVVEDAISRTGRLDYVFNNAGLGIFGEAHLHSDADWDLVLDVNLRGVINVVRSAYPRMIAQGYGHLVNTASVAGLIAPPFLSSYVATKHAVVGLSKSMRVEAKRYGVRVSALCPGAIRTPILTGGAQGRTLYDVSPERMLGWWKKLGITELEPFTKELVKAVERNEGVIVLPKKSRAMMALVRAVPRLEENMAEKLLDMTLKMFPQIGKRIRRTIDGEAKPASPTIQA
jgi:NAD(P)-dependent dehydrogenase (short-subunit alcohol dehydrogenase family)